MAYDYQQVCERLKHKAELLRGRYEIAVQQRDEARGEVQELTSRLAEREATIRELKTELQNLTIVKTAFPSKQAIAESRDYLTGLVREIDQCIKDLSN